MASADTADAAEAGAAEAGAEEFLALRQAALSCRACALANTRTRVVFGSGNPRARLMLIGEAPGKAEDAGGKPFIGAAGKLLDNLLSRAHLQRSDIFIANVLKCRPPHNRNPLPEEIAACAPWLAAQIKLISPLYIVTLGNFATHFILETKKSISSLRGSIYTRGRLRVLPTFHPAAALYDRKKIVLLEKDFDLLAAEFCAPPLERHGDLTQKGS